MDKSLDDIIKQNYKGGRGGFRGGFRNGGGGGRDDRPAGGAFRRARTTTRSAPYRSSRIDDRAQWTHDRFEEEEEEDNVREYGSLDAPVAGIETGTKILISNLDFNVSDGDVKDLFESIGDVKKAGVHYDKSGRSLGAATVVYSRREDAVAAVKKYNGIPLDGQPMKISLVGTNVHNAGAFQRTNTNDGANRFRRAVKEAKFTVSFGGSRTRRVVARGGGGGSGGGGGGGVGGALRTRRIITVGRTGSGGQRGGRGGRRGGRQVYVW